jgi:transposase
MSHFIRVPATFATYAGIDLHTTALTIAAIPNAGDGCSRRGIPTHCTGRLLDFIRGLPGPVCVGIESMGSFYWLWDLLLPEVAQLVLLDALDLSKMAPREANTDRTISARIAYALRDGKVPACYVPSKRIRRLRQLGRQWHRVTEMASTAKTQMRWQLHQNNCRGPREITCASMQRWMAAHGHKLERIPAVLMYHWQQIVFTVEQIRTDLRREMLGIVRGEEVLSHQLGILTSARGIAEILGIIILAEFGDFARFQNADTVACWTGLTERSHISNRQKYPGRISKAGSATLRWALCEAAFEIVCCDEKYQQTYEAIKAKTGKAAIARTAMGRRLARRLWKAVVSDTRFETGPARKRTQRANAVRLRRHRRKKRLAEKIAQNERIAQPVMTV